MRRVGRAPGRRLWTVLERSVLRILRLRVFTRVTRLTGGVRGTPIFMVLFGWRTTVTALRTAPGVGLCRTMYRGDGVRTRGVRGIPMDSVLFGW
jgi:hypothetical protein